MKFTGKMVEANGSSHYSVALDERSFPMCWGTIYKACCGLDLVYGFGRRYQFAWGYDGIEPDLLSISMLAVAMGVPFSNERFINFNEASMASVAHLSQVSGGKVLFGIDYLNNKPPQYCDNVEAEVKELYRAFTEEVIANLKPKWTLTTDEILQWIKTKQTKGKNK